MHFVAFIHLAQTVRLLASCVFTVFGTFVLVSVFAKPSRTVCRLVVFGNRFGDFGVVTGRNTLTALYAVYLLVIVSPILKTHIGGICHTFRSSVKSFGWVLCLLRLVGAVTAVYCSLFLHFSAVSNSACRHRQQNDTRDFESTLATLEKSW